MVTVLYSSALFALSWLLQVVYALNVTVDDADPAWTYTNAVSMETSGWEAVSPTTPSPTDLHIDLAQCFNETWHGTIGAGDSASINFFGSAVAAYVICATSRTTGVDDDINVQVTLNGIAFGPFSSALCTPTAYNFQLFSIQDITLNNYEMNITNLASEIDDSGSSFLALDYIVYETPEDATEPTTQISSQISSTLVPSTPLSTNPPQPDVTSTSKPFPTARVVAPLVAGAALIVIVGGLLCCGFRRKSSHPGNRNLSEEGVRGDFRFEPLSSAASGYQPKAPLRQYPPALDMAQLPYSSRSPGLQNESSTDVHVPPETPIAFQNIKRKPAPPLDSVQIEQLYNQRRNMSMVETSTEHVLSKQKVYHLTPEPPSVRQSFDL